MAVWVGIVFRSNRKHLFSIGTKIFCLAVSSFRSHENVADERQTQNKIPPFEVHANPDSTDHHYLLREENNIQPQLFRYTYFRSVYG